MGRTIDLMAGRAQGGAMRRLVCFVLGSAVLWPLSAAAQVQPHRAEYALRLGAAAHTPRTRAAGYALSPGLAGLPLQRGITTARPPATPSAANLCVPIVSAGTR